VGVFAPKIRQVSNGLESQLQRVGHWLSLRLEDGKPKNNIAVLDGVRGIACLLVIAYHISLLTSRETKIWVPVGPDHPLFSSIAYAGASGVTLFFVLSGFLLFLPYAKSLLFDNAWPAARLFYLRRGFRIIPAYYVCLFTIVLLSQQQYLQRAHWKEFALFLTFFMDSTSATNHQLNGPFWTLAVEWQFYLLLPLFAWGISLIVKRGSLKWRLWKLAFCLAALISWGVLTRYAGLYFALFRSRSFIVPRSTLNIFIFFLYGTSGKYLEDFAVGMLIGFCYICARSLPADHPFNILLRRMSIWLWRLGILLLLFMAMWHFDRSKFYTWPFLNWILRPGPFLNYYDWLSELGLSLGFGLCVIAILFGSAGLQCTFRWNPLRWIGLISYSMYMWHLPLILFFLTNVGIHFQGWNAALVWAIYWGWVLIVIIPFSFLSYLFVEKPWMRLGERFRPRDEKPKLEVTLASPTDNMAEPVLAKK